MAFDPFNDRLSRDIRNTLSSAMSQSLEKNNIALFKRTVQSWLDKPLESFHINYIHDRQQRFFRAFDEINQKKTGNALHQAVVLWNQGLYFEVHEILETLWLPSSGETREALKGLIQAAGVYMHMELKRHVPAKKLSKKALALLEKYGHCLPIDLYALTENLKKPDTVPPMLHFTL